MDMDNNFDAFDEYAMKFDLNDKMIAYKYNHSYRVMKECENIAKSLNLDEEDIYLSNLIGLLHDIGRFYHWSEFKTFKDGEYFDHADYACKILFEDGLINKFELEKENYDIVKKSIKNHNKYEIDKKDIDESEELFCKIIRDADKLDIMYAFSNPRILELKTSDEEIRKEIKDDFFNHKLTKIDNKLNQNEKVVEFIAYVYDLNFDYSKEKVLKEKYLEKMYKGLNNKKIFKEYIDEATKYLKGNK